ncbi:sigma-70 family RNA polymerase sigma factor [Rubripirellula amarantea]|nr:sigma-70 family RNA polymerase sigma factor [Rubripirellula amarantea]
MAKETSQSDKFVELLTEHQPHLRGFIMAAVADNEYASDILQQTNLVLWQKFDDLQAENQFLSWALTIARYKILSFVRDQQRSRVVFSSLAMETMMEVAGESIGEVPQRQLALRTCLKQVSEANLAILRQRYLANRPIQQIADSADRSIDSVKSLLKRIRRSLADCIERKLNGSDTVVQS